MCTKNGCLQATFSVDSEVVSAGKLCVPTQQFQQLSGSRKVNVDTLDVAVPLSNRGGHVASPRSIAQVTAAGFVTGACRYVNRNLSPARESGGVIND